MNDQHRTGAAPPSDGAATDRPAPIDSGHDTTHFGYEQVPVADKARRVASVFASVAPRYDMMNDLMSLGSHRLMKRMTIELSGVRPGHRVLDLAGGTGDLAALFSPRVAPNGQVVLADINPSMLERGRDLLLDAGLGNVRPVLADAESLPFPDACFDCVSIGFGLRNVTHKGRALAEMHRVLAPGGRLLVLEFSHPRNPLLGRAFDAWTSLWPTLGKLVTGDAESYRYLDESIHMHPPQEALSAMLEAAGFTAVRCHDLAGGIVALHRGIRP